MRALSHISACCTVSSPRAKTIDIKRRIVDASGLYASDPEVCRYSPWGPNSLDETRAFVADCLRDKEVVPRTRHTLAVTLEDAVIGAVTVVEGPDAVAELGYVMNRSFWGAGFATEAASRALRWAFDDLRASSVFATCRPNNAASIRVLEKTGMRRDALLVDHMWMRDHWEDSYRFVLP